MLAMRVKFDRPLRRVTHDSSKPVQVVETTKITVPVPTQTPPPATVKPPALEVPPLAEDETPSPQLEELEQVHRDEIKAIEERHRAELETLRETLKQMGIAIDEGIRTRKLQTNELQQLAVELATTAAARLLHEEVTAGRFPIEAMVRDMAKELDTESTLTVYLNPTDLTSLQERLDLTELLPDHGQLVRIAPDSTLARGSCRLETPDAMLLGELGGQLQTIRDEFLRSLEHATGS